MVRVCCADAYLCIYMVAMNIHSSLEKTKANGIETLGSVNFCIGRCGPATAFLANQSVLVPK